MNWITVTMRLSLFIAGAFVSAAAGISPEFQNVLQNTHKSNEYGYPTDFTRGIMPVSPVFLFVFILWEAELTNREQDPGSFAQVSPDPWL